MPSEISRWFYGIIKHMLQRYFMIELCLTEARSLCKLYITCLLLAYICNLFFVQFDGHCMLLWIIITIYNSYTFMYIRLGRFWFTCILTLISAYFLGAVERKLFVASLNKQASSEEIEEVSFLHTFSWGRLSCGSMYTLCIWVCILHSWFWK